MPRLMLNNQTLQTNSPSKNSDNSPQDQIRGLTIPKQPSEKNLTKRKLPFHTLEVETKILELDSHASSPSMNNQIVHHDSFEISNLLMNGAKFFEPGSISPELPANRQYAKFGKVEESDYQLEKLQGAVNKKGYLPQIQPIQSRTSSKSKPSLKLNMGKQEAKASASNNEKPTLEQKDIVSDSPEKNKATITPRENKDRQILRIYSSRRASDSTKPLSSERKLTVHKISTSNSSGPETNNKSSKNLTLNEYQLPEPPREKNPTPKAKLQITALPKYDLAKAYHSTKASNSPKSLFPSIQFKRKAISPRN